ncbi:MAG: hypothetical protein EOP24_42120 [Hyphomicrobiales bacterium]|nr:MAG: hypothetical protein EOP24_42120 [Hyphomicrobiales bacterium]
MTHTFPTQPKPKGHPLFELGRTVATPGAIELMALTETSPLVLLLMHVSGDWGECDAEDKKTNDDALKLGGRVMSVYRLPLTDKKKPEEGARSPLVDTEDDRVWVITEADRSVTTILLPEEY